MEDEKKNKEDLISELRDLRSQIAQLQSRLGKENVAASKSDARYRDLFENANDAIFLIDPHLKYIDVNRKATELFGYSREEFLRLNVGDLIPEEQLPRADKEFRKLKEERSYRNFVGRARKKDGSWMDVEVNSSVIMDGDRFVGSRDIVRDVSERIRAEERSLQSERRFRAIYENTPMGVAIVDIDKKFIACNSAYRKMTGYGLEELRRMTFADITHPDDNPRNAVLYGELVEGKRDSFTLEKKYLRKDGTVLWGNLTSAIIKNYEGGPPFIFGMVEDITERKITEEELQSSRQFVRSILDTVDEGFIVIDREYRIISANTAYGRHVKMPLADIIGKHCYEVSHRCSSPCYEAGEECAVHRSFEDGEPYISTHAHHNKDGGAVFVETKSYPLKDASGDVIAAIEVINDITDKQLLEEQLLRTQKLEAVGLLAGGIAHDFNNLLQGVFGYISLAKMLSDKGGKVHKTLEKAETALTLSTNLTKQLLTFSKGGEPVKKVLIIDSLIKDAVKFALSGSNVQYRFSIDRDLCPVEVDGGQISQVMQNIVLNASEAMPDGGMVSIDVRNALIGRESNLPLNKGTYVVTSIEDSGPGIPEKYLSQLFDPYFTTKKKGSGLGLATSYSIIKRHGGLLNVKSQPGTGSTFFIYLPATEKELTFGGEVAGTLSKGEGRILLMDDEEIVRTVAGEMIVTLGYSVDFAENGEQAVAKYVSAMSAGAPFDAVILDLTIRGGMGGKDAMLRMREVAPSIKAIVSSGYSDDPVLSSYADHGFVATLSKPYELNELSRVLRSVICGE